MLVERITASKTHPVYLPTKLQQFYYVDNS